MPTKKTRNSDSPRSRHLFVEVTENEARRIRNHCTKKKLSMAKFLLDVVLTDVRGDGPRTRDGKETDVRTISLSFSQVDYVKLRYKARLREQDLDEFIKECLRPKLRKRKEFGGSPRRSRKILRYYLNDAEHANVLSYMKRHKLSSQHYLAVRALEVLEATT
jgi:hypothetical protein